MTEPQIHGLFPTPVLMTNIDRRFTDEEVIFFTEQSRNTVTNEGNVTSKDNYVFKQDVMKTLHEDVLNSVKLYMSNVLNTTDDVVPYITQSWLNYTKPGQFHHKHEHPNSFLSGVLYINADPKKDKIHFYNNRYRQIKPQLKDWNWWNSDSWWFEVKTGGLVIFPSNLTHMVEQTQSEDTRISLAFNTFLKGSIGRNQDLTELLNP
jgi:uncharacterized protein (TIGR02466 family)